MMIKVSLEPRRLDVPVDQDPSQAFFEEALGEVCQGHGTAHSTLVGIQCVDHVVPVVCLASAFLAASSNQAMRLRTRRSISEIRWTLNAHLANSPTSGGIVGSK